jgi:peptidase MA superfamily protein
MGKALRGGPGDGEGRRGAVSGKREEGRGKRIWRLASFVNGVLTLAIGASILCSTIAVSHAAPRFLGPAFGGHPPGSRAQSAPARLDRGRFTAVFYPADATLAHALVARALANDSFPGLPRPTQHVLIAIAPDSRRFHEWIGPTAPEWGAAVAFPESRRVVMQGRNAGSDAGDPLEVLRHELAHLALHEYLGDLPTRWFDEGYASYAARELMRNEVLAANVALAVGGMPTFDQLEERFGEGASSAQAAYALAYRAVDDMAAIDPERGLTLLFRQWKATGSLDRAMRAAYGITLAGFERDWQQRTRRRYGGLALFGDLTLAGLLVLLIITPLYLARRRRDRRRMAALVAADAAAAQGEHERVLDALLGERAAIADPDPRVQDESTDAGPRRPDGPGDEPQDKA